MSPRPLQITFVTGRLNLSGGIKVVRIMSDLLAARGHDVRVVYWDVPVAWPNFWQVRQIARRLVAQWKARGKPAHHMFGCSAVLVPLSEPWSEFDRIPNGDVAIATWWETAEWISKWPASKGVGVYYIQHHELHGGPPERVASTYRLPLKKIVIAKWLLRTMSAHYGDSSAVLVPNGVEWDLFNSTPRGKARVPTVGFMYGTQPYKGAAVAIEAIKLLKRQIPALRVVSFGSKLYSPEIDAPDYIEFMLRPPQKLIPEIYRSADCWLLPSTTEGFGLPGLEAAACRCPVVTTRCGGPEDYVIDGKTGYVVDIGDAPAMADRAQAVLELSDEAWRDMSEASYETARNFDWNKSVALFERALYEFAGVNGESKGTAK
jgi:glycosyltransferase involved in cell wall biosynthesis